MTGQKARFRKIRRILLSILAFNWLVALAKIVVGLLANISSMVADGLHSFSDGASNIIGMIGIRLASRPPDTDHPYGHRKYETLFSMAIGALLLFLSFNLIMAGLSRIKKPAEMEVGWINFSVMALTMLINFIVMVYEHGQGKRLNSDILVSDAAHTKADIFTSISVIFAMIAIKLGFPILDPIVTLVIAFFIATEGFFIIKAGSLVLCDTAVILDNKKIEGIVLSVEGVIACHKIRSRGREDDVHVDLHVQVAPDMHIDEAHKISYRIEDAIKKGVPGVSDVVLHLEPKDRKGKIRSKK